MTDRRSVLRLLVGGVALKLLTGPGDEAAALTALRTHPGTSQPCLTPTQRRLAALGERLEVTSPDAVDRLFEFVSREAARYGFDVTRMEEAGRLCSFLLSETRVHKDFRNGHLQVVDGWILARSEAGAGVYLHRLMRPSGGAI